MTHFVEDLAVVLAVAAVTSIIFRRLGQSTVLGYLFAGLVVGPYIPIPIFADADRIHALSEFGVALVMFAVGLEFSIRKLARVLPVAGFTGLLQVCVLAAAGFAYARVVGLTTMDGVFLGACIAISSTMVVAKVFSDHAPDPRTRELVFGILVVQDLAAILLVAALTAVAAGATLSPDMLGATLGNLAWVLGALVVVGLLVVPRLLRMVDELGSPEILLVTAVAVCFGLGTLAQRLGYSIALGAFLAGTLVAEAGRTERIERVVHPVRDLFAAVFFVSVGMSVDPRLAIEHAGLALGVVALVVGGQLAAVTIMGVLTGNGVRRSVTAGLSLGQVGEFGFIIATIGAQAGVVDASLPAVVVTVAVVTAFTTPWLVRASDRIATTIEHGLPRRLQTFASVCESWFQELRRVGGSRRGRSHLRNAAIVIGVDATAIAAIWLAHATWGPRLGSWAAGRFGLSPVVAPLVVFGIGVLVTAPLVVAMLRSARRAGQLLADRVIPPAAGPSRGAAPERAVDLGRAPRRAFVLTLQLVVVLAVTSPIAVLITPFLDRTWALVLVPTLALGVGIYLWRSAADLDGHVRAGAAVLGQLLREQMAPEAETSPSPEALLPGLGTPVAVPIAAGHVGAGRTLQALDVRATTGATIVAIERDGKTLAMPAGGDHLQVGDTVVLIGSDDAIADARLRLTVGVPDPGDGG